jgi:hypothetical protein
MARAYDTCPDCWHERLKHQVINGCAADDGRCDCRLTPAEVAAEQRRRDLRGHR